MTTKPTIQADKSVGATLGAAEWNVNALQQARWTQEVLAGTNSDKIQGAAMASPTTFPGSVNFNNDTNFGTTLAAGVDPQLTLDAGGDGLVYSRSGNKYQFYVANTVQFTIDGNGLLAGTGFYRSTEVTITNGNNANFAHGLAAKPCNVYGVHGTVTTNNLTIIGQSSVTFGQIDATNINVANASGATRFVLVNATK